MLAVPCQAGAWFTAWHGIAVDVPVAELVAALGVFLRSEAAFRSGISFWVTTHSGNTKQRKNVYPSKPGHTIRQLCHAIHALFVLFQIFGNNEFKL